eukprot:m.489574 g.489574  ORF g.489574 m.489574 type:complete len:324 (+) comp21769_c0_seq9:734-1705(+)
MGADALVSYKRGAGYPEAHADLLCDTGSLGQCLSTIAGLATAEHVATGDCRRHAIIVGDGELQEGQNYEALMTMTQFNMTNVTIFVDCNGYQSDNRCVDIIGIHDMGSVFRGFGWEVVDIDGNDYDQVQTAWHNAAGKRVAVLARTDKGFGTHMQPVPHPETGLSWHPWHTKIPSWDLYERIIDELIVAANIDAATRAWQDHPKDWSGLANTHRPLLPAQSSMDLGTGKAFGQYICELMHTRQDLAIVSADLATSCGFNAAVNGPRYYEVRLPRCLVHIFLNDRHPTAASSNPGFYLIVRGGSAWIGFTEEDGFGPHVCTTHV